MTPSAHAAETSRLSALDAVLDAQHGATLSGDLFAVVDLLDQQPALRRALTDPGKPVSVRQQLATSLLQGKVGEGTLSVLTAAVEHRWASGRDFVAALERQAVRAVFASVAGGSGLDEVEDELFRFGRLVASDQGLRNAIADRAVSVGRREELVRGLLVDRAAPATTTLATRAVRARERSFTRTLEGYLELAAQVRQRAVATVRVARPLEADQQARLQAVLTRQAGRPVAMHVVVDPAVLGGIRVELGDEVIEGTVAARLEEARRRLH
ncbi:F0F1 ATP synthase subunit delta [Desertihabitans aurantiacus]|uniref:F0F1 ATP synthase subunit delta n=1 Tax=Desertihabitans aurantiacus TaxID=2282477 RepID=UPI000DF76A28|nr:F0F1 ATP synthase subunit delta [Desertihabitans aurantiacus]